MPLPSPHSAFHCQDVEKNDKNSWYFIIKHSHTNLKHPDSKPRLSLSK